jgi:putative hydrolase of the HAD superfamily
MALLIWFLCGKRSQYHYDVTAQNVPISQTLLIDADDTLWENNIYFERAIADFISFLNHQEHSPAEVRAILNEVERECVLTHGYGLRSFTHSLVRTFEKLSVEPITPALHETIHGFARTIAEQPVQLLPCVEETLEYLARRHRLVLVTKGDHAEQSGKVRRSGLQKHFSAVEIVPEKTAQHYRELVEQHRLAPERTWMVGNSPKSDINPALAAGLNAVFVPHNDTWILEHEDLATPPSAAKLLVLNSFAELRQHF